MMSENETTTAFSSSTPAGATNRAAVIAPGAGVGRRKEAVARVRLVPGSGRWTVN
ncbi:MAG: 30S ribosomal protein S9, partial [Actinobacteria bacterium]|nr:30S ribosomal protein S9 [Actinomycetota bacterium]